MIGKTVFAMETPITRAISDPRMEKHMAELKNKKYQNNVNQCANMFKVLSDETRLAVVKQLLSQPKQVNELNEQLPVSQSLLSHHLKILRDAGLVYGKRQGKAVVYEISPKLKTSKVKNAINLGCCNLEFVSKRGRII